VRKPAYLFSSLEKIKRTLKDRFVYLFLDYDGTLAPIAETPGKAAMSMETNYLLRRLSKAPNCKVAIVSGRALKDVSGRIGLKNIIYVGNHGFEIRGPKIDFKSPLPYRYIKTLAEIKSKLEKKLSPVKGVFIEDKGYSLSVHYRAADKIDRSLIETEFYSALLLYEVRKNVLVGTGKLVLEVKPPVIWDKGKAVLWLLARRKFVLSSKKIKVFPVYIGDDVTDEDAFRSLKGRGMTIFVGKPKGTEARLYLKDTRDVVKFLKIVLENAGRSAS